MGEELAGRAVFAGEEEEEGGEDYGVTEGVRGHDGEPCDEWGDVGEGGYGEGYGDEREGGDEECCGGKAEDLGAVLEVVEAADSAREDVGHEPELGGFVEGEAGGDPEGNGEDEEGSELAGAGGGDLAIAGDGVSPAGKKDGELDGSEGPDVEEVVSAAEPDHEQPRDQGGHEELDEGKEDPGSGKGHVSFSEEVEGLSRGFR